MSRNRSLAGRAILAVVLLVGFYGLSIAVAGLLLILPWAELHWGHRLHIKLAVVCVAGAVVVLWAAIPRRDRFVVPGPRLDRAGQPRLFEALEDVAGRVGQPMPAEVYLIPQVNAWVAQRGGMSGLGGRRIMGIGMPLLLTLDVSELKAVLAHEFGHFHGGDTNLGAFVYQTRAAIGRTVDGLTSEDGRAGALAMPFVAYGKMFMRVTQKVSRAQEVEADALSARTVGRGPLVSGLKKLQVLDGAYDGYLSTEFSPAISFGLMPPLADGFARFLGAAEVKERVAKELATVVEDARAAPVDEAMLAYESHPRLPARIDALDALELPEPPPLDTRPAIALLDDVPALDLALTRDILRPNVVASVRAVAWDEVGPAGYLVHYRKHQDRYAAALGGVTVGGLAERFDGVRALLVERMKEGAPPDVEDAVFADEAASVLAAALVVVLCDRGFTVTAAPGEAVTLHGSGGALSPFAEVRALAGSPPPDARAWRGRFEALGVADAPLAPAQAA